MNCLCKTTLFTTAALAASLAVPAFADTAKNVILMVSDGASWGTWDMASYYEYGQKGMQPYDSFDVKLGMTTYPLNTSNTPTGTGIPQISYDWELAWDTTPTGDGDFFAGYDYIKADYTDSAAAGTALSSGVRTYNNAIGFDDFGQPVKLITHTATALGKSTGVVSSVPWTHATPAAFGAQNISRNHYGEISKQMISDESISLDVIMGGGHPLYNSDGVLRAPGTERFANETGTGGGFIAKSVWDDLEAGVTPFTLIQDKADFDALANGTFALTPATRIVGTPKVGDTLQYGRTQATQGADASTPSGVAYNPNVPDLVTMTKGALNVLNQNDNGFFLMVEGGAVDWAAHANDTARIIEEQIDFNKSVAEVVSWIGGNGGWDENLLIVLTDHGNGMPMGPESDTIAFQPIQNNGQGNLPGVLWHYGTHTNENTLMWAMGAGSELFYSMIQGYDFGLRYLDHNADGAYIDNTDVFKVMNTSIPEPASLALLALGGAALIARRRSA